MPDSFFSTPPADVFGGTHCSDKVTHPKKAHTAEDTSLLPLPGAPSAIAANSSFSSLPAQISPEQFCLVFQRDVEYMSIRRALKSHILKASYKHTGVSRGVWERRAIANREIALKTSCLSAAALAAYVVLHLTEAAAPESVGLAPFVVE